MSHSKVVPEKTRPIARPSRALISAADVPELRQAVMRGKVAKVLPALLNSPGSYIRLTSHQSGQACTAAATSSPSTSWDINIFWPLTTFMSWPNSSMLASSTTTIWLRLDWCYNRNTPCCFVLTYNFRRACSRRGHKRKATPEIGQVGPPSRFGSRFSCWPVVSLDVLSSENSSWESGALTCGRFSMFTLDFTTATQFELPTLVAQKHDPVAHRIMH